MPTVTNLNEWNVKVALALAQASGYGGQKEVWWLQECNEATRSFESFGDSGGNGYVALDDKIGHAMQSGADANPILWRELERVSRREYTKGTIVAWSPYVLLVVPAVEG